MLHIEEQTTDQVSDASIDDNIQNLYVNSIDSLFVSDNTTAAQLCIGIPYFNST